MKIFVVENAEADWDAMSAFGRVQLIHAFRIIIEPQLQEMGTSASAILLRSTVDNTADTPGILARLLTETEGAYGRAIIDANHHARDRYPCLISEMTFYGTKDAQKHTPAYEDEIVLILCARNKDIADIIASCQTLGFQIPKPEGVRKKDLQVLDIDTVKKKFHWYAIKYGERKDKVLINYAQKTALT